MASRTLAGNSRIASATVADMPYPKKPDKLPLVLSQDEVAQLIDSAATPIHRLILMTLYATGMRRAEVTQLKIAREVRIGT